MSKLWYLWNFIRCALDLWRTPVDDQDGKVEGLGFWTALECSKVIWLD